MTAPQRVKDVPADVFVKAYAEHLKNQDKFQLPPWVDLVKTGRHKEMSPYDPDWMYIRAGECPARPPRRPAPAPPHGLREGGRERSCCGDAAGGEGGGKEPLSLSSFFFTPWKRPLPPPGSSMHGNVAPRRGGGRPRGARS